MNYILFLLNLLTTTIFSIVPNTSPDIEIIYPKDKATINAPSTFIIGNTHPNATLKINGKKVKVYPNGGFVQVVKLKEGDNSIKLNSKYKKQSDKLAFTLTVPRHEKTIPKSPLKIDASTIKPNKNLSLMPGDTIIVKFKGSTGNKASFAIGNRKEIPMIELPPRYTKTAPAFGKSYKTSKKPLKGFYKGSYKIQPSDRFYNTPVKIKLASKNKAITKIINSRLTTLSTKVPKVARVIKNKAVVRTFPGGSRLTPLPKGVRLQILQIKGNDYKFKMSNSMEGWIAKKDIRMLPYGTPAPTSIIRHINVNSYKNKVLIEFPLTERLPFKIDQVPGPQMNVNIFGAVANIDVYQYNPDDDFIKEIKWVQVSKDHFKTIITPKTKQFWGYDYYYKNNNLILELKKKPLINIESPLKGKVITVDPGHGGNELGAVGPTGVPEKEVNLSISKYMKEELEKRGAKVVMTRFSNTKDVGLYRRVKIANNYNTDVLLSIHNNALPDGRDPYKDHGASTYYYNSQSLPLAKSIQKSMVDELKLKDFGVFWSSLVLTRPYEYLAVLIEIAFMINPDEYMLLTDKEFQKKSAIAICDGLENFYKSQVNAKSKQASDL